MRVDIRLRTLGKRPVFAARFPFVRSQRLHFGLGAQHFDPIADRTDYPYFDLGNPGFAVDRPGLMTTPPSVVASPTRIGPPFNKRMSTSLSDCWQCTGCPERSC